MPGQSFRTTPSGADAPETMSPTFSTGLVLRWINEHDHSCTKFADSMYLILVSPDVLVPFDFPEWNEHAFLPSKLPLVPRV